METSSSISSSENMKKLLISLLLICIAVLAVDRIGGLGMQWVSRNSQDVLSPKLWYIQDSIHEDVILMGTSRCHHHFVPSILADTLGMSVYNAGVGGSGNIFSHYMLLCHILAHHTPKIICLDITTSDFTLQESPLSAVCLFAPLYGKNEQADSVFRLAGTYWAYKISHLYRYNAKAASNLWGLILNRQKESDKGYMPLPQPKDKNRGLKLEEDPLEFRDDDNKIVYLQRFISYCKQKGILLILVVSPKYTKVAPDCYATPKKIAEDNGIPFLDYHTHALYHTHPEYFKDINHLYDKGARLFSSAFAFDLKRCVSSRTGAPHHSHCP